MKALLFIPQLDRGGPDRVFAELAANLPKHGVETSVLVQVAGGDHWARLPAEVEKSVLPGESGQGAVKAYPVKAFAEHVRQAKPDVVLCTLRSQFTAAAAALTGRLKVPLVVRPANHLTRNSLELMRQSPLKHSLSWLAGIASLHVARHVICQSEDLFNDFRRYGVRASKLSVIGNPIELPDAGRVAQLAQDRLVGKPSLVAVGRLMPQKGFDILIDAIGRLKRRLPEVHLSIYGEGPDRAMLEAQIQRLDLAGHVTLAGFTKEIDKPVAAASFLVSSSRYEGFPNVILEALSLGTPVVATDCPGGTSELVVEGKTGWLCRHESPEALADAIERAFHAQRLLGADLRQFVEERYSTARVVQAYARVLQQAAKMH